MELFKRSQISYQKRGGDEIYNYIEVKERTRTSTEIVDEEIVTYQT